MTTFKNLRKWASVTHEANGYTLTGEVQLNEADNRITAFNGSVGNGTVSCNFYYGEQDNGNVNYNVTAPAKIRRAIEDIVFAVAADVHTELDVKAKAE